MKILWGTRKGAEDWREELITEDESQIPDARAWAEKNGFDRFRIAEIDLATPPDFAGTVNIRKEPPRMPIDYKARVRQAARESGINDPFVSDAERARRIARYHTEIDRLETDLDNERAEKQKEANTTSRSGHALVDLLVLLAVLASIWYATTEYRSWVWEQYDYATMYERSLDHQNDPEN